MTYALRFQTGMFKHLRLGRELLQGAAVPAEEDSLRGCEELGRRECSEVYL